MAISSALLEGVAVLSGRWRTVIIVLNFASSGGRCECASPSAASTNTWDLLSFLLLLVLIRRLSPSFVAALLCFAGLDVSSCLTLVLLHSGVSTQMILETDVS